MTQHFPINLFVKFGPKYPGKIMILLRKEKKNMFAKKNTALPTMCQQREDTCEQVYFIPITSGDL